MDRPAMDITQWLRDAEQTGSEAIDTLFEQLYSELKGVASRRLRDERPDHTLSATALVNEAYLKLSGLDELRWQNRAQFFAIAARAMRRILSNHARDRKAGKRGGGAAKVTLVFGGPDEPADATVSWDQIITAEDALNELAELNERQAQVAELRVFGGMMHTEIAEALDVSVPTVERDWRLARAFLARALSDD